MFWQDDEHLYDYVSELRREQALRFLIIAPSEAYLPVVVEDGLTCGTPSGTSLSTASPA